MTPIKVEIQVKVSFPKSQGQILAIKFPILSDNPYAERAINEAVMILMIIGIKKYFQSFNFDIKAKAPV